MTRAAAELFFSDYAASFSRRDAEGVLRQWALPASISGSGGKSGVFPDAGTFLSNVQALCDFYARQGVVRAEKKVLDVQSLFDEVALVRTGDQLFDSGGNIV